MKILLVAGGVLANPAALLRKITPADYGCIIAVDHGYDHCAALGLHADILMGDLDSVEAVPPAQGSALQIIPFAPEKDDTDLRLAAQHALRLGASSIDIICAGGGRLDHFMGNLSLLEFLQEESPATPVRILDEGNVIRLLATERKAARETQGAAEHAAAHCPTSATAHPAMGTAQSNAPHPAPTRYPRRSKYISVIPVSETICFTGQGLKYPAQCLTVRRSNMISISNEALGDDYAIALHSGKALLIEAD